MFEEASVFIPTRKRQHASFNFETGLMARLSKNELKRKININQLLIKKKQYSYYIFMYLKAILSYMKNDNLPELYLKMRVRLQLQYKSIATICNDNKLFFDITYTIVTILGKNITTFRSLHMNVYI